MKLYNTLNRKIETFKPIKDDEVTLYTCGPTVYDYYHIGNIRNAVFNDTLRRTINASGYNVKHVMNITDVGHLVSDADQGDDKLEKGALREGKSVWEIAKHYTEAFKSDMLAMNVLPPNAYVDKNNNDNYARATNFIVEQIEMVKLLIDKGFAYKTEHAIYFDVAKLPSYGILTGQKLSEKETGARSDVVTDPEKRNSHDFAVWFMAIGHFENHTMQWDSPWGSGFPGWHLECSAIIHATLGDPIDIHTGGIDHIGTHHPNEMAQTEAAYGHILANYWVHNEFILVDGAKMSKSKGNSYTLENVKSRGLEPMALRLIYLQAHYRTELNFSWDNLESAQNRLSRWRSIADLLFQKDKVTSITDKEHSHGGVDILGALQNDLDTPKALELIEHEFGNFENKPICFICLDNLIKSIDELLGIKIQGNDIDAKTKSLIHERHLARENKNWELSDKLRDDLHTSGIGIKDNGNLQIWFRL